MTALVVLALLVSLNTASAYGNPVWTGGGITLGNVTVVYTTDTLNATGNADNITFGFDEVWAPASFQTPAGNITTSGTDTLIFIVDRGNTSHPYYQIARNTTWNISFNAGTDASENSPTHIPINITSISFEMLGLTMNHSVDRALICWNSTGGGICEAPDSITDSDGDGYYELTLAPTVSEQDWRLASGTFWGATSGRNYSVNISLVYWDEMTVGHTEINKVERTMGEADGQIRVLGAGSTLNTVLVNSTFNLTIGNPFYNVTNFNVSYFLPTNALSGWQTFINNMSNGSRETWINWTQNSSRADGTNRINMNNISCLGFGCTNTDGSTISIHNETMPVTVLYSVDAPYLYANTTIEGPDGNIDGDVSPTNDFEREYVIRFNASKGTERIDNITAYNVVAELSWNDKSYDDEFWAEVWVENNSHWRDITPQRGDQCGTLSRNYVILGQTWTVCRLDRDGNEKPESMNVTIPALNGNDVIIRLGGEANSGRPMILDGTRKLEICGNNKCAGGETAVSCARDCAPSNTGKPFGNTNLPNIPLSHIGIAVLVLGIAVYAINKGKKG